MLLVRPCNSIFVFTAISRPPFCVLRYRRFPVNYMPPPSSFPSSSRSEREDNSRYYTVLSNNNRLFNPTSIRRIYNTTLRVIKGGSRRWMDFFFVTKKELIPKFVTRGRLHRKKKRKKKKNPSSFDEGISFRKVKGRDDTLETRTLEICTMRAASSSPWMFYGVIRRQGSLVRGWRTRRGGGGGGWAPPSRGVIDSPGLGRGTGGEEMRSEAYIYGEFRRSFPQSLLLLPKEYEENQSFCTVLRKFLFWIILALSPLFLFLSRSKERKKIEKICLVSRKYWKVRR